MKSTALYTINGSCEYYLCNCNNPKSFENPFCVPEIGL